jgi:hypothetical protein
VNRRGDEIIGAVAAALAAGGILTILGLVAVGCYRVATR